MNNIEKAKQALFFAKRRKEYERNERFYKGMGNEKKIIVLAGNWNEFTDYVRERGLPISKFIYADMPSKIMGVEAEEVVEVGTYYKRKEVVELRMLARSRLRN